VTGNDHGEQMLSTPSAERVWRREFSSAGDTASATRRWLRAAVGEHVVKERLDTATLLVGELIASSVRGNPANQPITVLLTLGARLLRVDVINAKHDSRPTLTAEMQSHRGGLIMVGRNARSWGMTSGPPARVWFAI